MRCLSSSKNFGKTQYFPLHEQLGAARNSHSKTGWAVVSGPDNLIRNFLCTDKAIPVSMKRWNNASAEKKSWTLVLSHGSGMAGATRATNIYAWMATRQSTDWTAPKWRRAEPGLCLEGKCTNVACHAHGSMVIVNMGFSDFDLSLQYDDCFCPLCLEPVAPMKPGFNNCFWRIIAVKFDTKERLDTYWTKTENEYFTFDADACGTTTLSVLRIFIRPFNEKPYSDVPVPVPKSCNDLFSAHSQERAARTTLPESCSQELQR